MLVRAYFATAYPGRPIRANGGVFTNGVLGFLNMMVGAVEQLTPQHLFVAWDVSRDTFRREQYPAYKGTRGELPDELLGQFDTTQQVLTALGIAQAAHERYEADDLIGTLSVRASDAGFEVIVLTSDRDALQLVSPRVTVALMKKGITEMQFVTPDVLLATWGLRPEQIKDLKGLMGDTSDNIPGVPGIGEKTAMKLLGEFDTLENLLDNTHTLSGKLKDRLEQHRELAVLSKSLATIALDAPVPYEPADCRLSIRLDQAAALLADLGLHKMLTQLERMVSAG